VFFSFCKYKGSKKTSERQYLEVPPISLFLGLSCQFPAFYIIEATSAVNIINAPNKFKNIKKYNKNFNHSFTVGPKRKTQKQPPAA